MRSCNERTQITLILCCLLNETQNYFFFGGVKCGKKLIIYLCAFAFKTDDVLIKIGQLALTVTIHKLVEVSYMHLINSILE